MLAWVFPVRIIQTLLGLAVVGLTAYVITSLQSGWAFSNAVDYVFFTGCWTAFIAVPYLQGAPLWFSRLAHEYVIPLVEILTSTFWFAAFIALAALLPSAGSCDYSSCHALQAIIVIGAVEWALFVLTNVYAIMDLINSRQNAAADTKIRDLEAESRPETRDVSQEHV